MPPRPRGMLAATAGCLFASGAASLILEVVWARSLRLVFGSTTLAVSTVLVAYMLGLGLGGLLGGRAAARFRNGLRAYGWMEVGIGAYALCVPWMLGLLTILDRGWLTDLGFWPTVLARFLMVLVVLLVPTLLMGATLPVLVGALVGAREGLANRVGLLYGVNTLGAVAGVCVATFLLFETVGLARTNAAGAALDLVVGLIALVALAPRWARASDGSPAAAAGQDAAPRVGPSTSPSRWNPALAAYGLVGFTALVYEVSWTRALAMVLGSSVYAFATMLAAFLAGIALGSVLGRSWCGRLASPLAGYALGVGALGLLALGTLGLFHALPRLFVLLIVGAGPTPAGVVTTGMAVSLLGMLGPTLVLGALFPLLARVMAEEGWEPRVAVGDIYFVNTVGSAAGAFAAGFVLVPALGLRRTMVLAAVLNLATAAALLLWQRQWTGRYRTAAAALACAIALAVLLVPPGWNEAGLTRGVYRYPGREIGVGVGPVPLKGVAAETLLYYRDGVSATVSVHRVRGQTLLKVNGKTDAGTAGDMPTQVLLGHVPLLFGPRAEQVLVIGLASGVTAGSAALHGPAHLDVVEIEPAMLQASHFFDEYNHRPLERPFVRVIIDDARGYLGRTRERYDVIISEPSNPWVSGAASLFTREFFREARRALRPGGRLLQWVEFYSMEPPALRALLASVRAEFPRVYGFVPASGAGDLLLLAMDAPLAPVDLPSWDALGEPVREDLRRINIFSTADLWSALRLLPGDIDAVIGGSRTINTDDNMRVELSTPWALYDPSALDRNRKELSRFSGGPAAIAEQAGPPLDGEMLGALALSYTRVRTDPVAAADLLRRSFSRGGGAAALVVEAEMKVAGDPRAVGASLGLLDEAVRRYPAAFLPLLYRAGLRAVAGRHAEALEDAGQALRIQPGDLRARYARLRALNALGRPEEAWTEAEGLLRSPQASRVPEVRVEAARAAAALGRLDDAIGEMRRYLERDPGAQGAWELLSRMYEAAGRLEEAKDARTNAQLAARNRILTLHQNALRAERLGFREDAIALLKDARAADPTYEPARQELRRLGVPDS